MRLHVLWTQANKNIAPHVLPTPHSLFSSEGLGNHFFSLEDDLGKYQTVSILSRYCLSLFAKWWYLQTV